MRHYWTLNKIFSEILFKLKLKIIGEFGHTLGIVGKPLEVEFKEGDLKFLRPMVWQILNFEYFLLLEIQLNYDKGFGR